MAPPGGISVFQRKHFKTLILWNCKANTFDYMYVVSPYGPLPRLYTLWPMGSKLPRPGAFISLNRNIFENHLLWNW